MDIIIQSATYSSTQGIQKKARPTLPWVKGSRLAVQNSFPSDLVGDSARKPLRGSIQKVPSSRIMPMGLATLGQSKANGEPARDLGKAKAAFDVRDMEASKAVHSVKT